MRRIFHNIALLILWTSLTDSLINIDTKRSLSSYLKKSFNHLRSSLQSSAERDQSRFQVKRNDVNTKVSKLHKKVNDGVQKAKNKNAIPRTKTGYHKNDQYRLDPVLNFIERRSSKYKRRLSDTSDSSSSSLEMQNWKEEWKDHWIKKKLEAINSTEPRGDVVNMVAARPWGVSCGDPNQHDMPWGTCMLPMECEAEYRIYRGDYFCGRTQFVCCALQLTNYDMYQGFDASLADSGLTTSSEEARNRGKGSKEKKKRRRRREKGRRKRERDRRKKKIKRNIAKINREIRKILNRSYRNGTTQRKRKTKQLKKFIRDLKKRYKQERKAVKGIHEVELVKIDAALLNRLNEIRALNNNFAKNSTFREIILNRTISKQGARMLVEAYPELQSYFTPGARRSGTAGKTKDYLDYDVEYGMLYY